jgi:pentatricopeptide repeat protein
MISSQLSSQLFPKNLAWALVCEKYPADFWQRTAPAAFTIEVWQRCVRVHLPKSEWHRGVSLFLSFWDFIDAFMVRSQAKSQLVRVMQVRKNIFTATSSQGSEGDLHTINFTLWGASCTCMLYKCLRNRIVSECPYYFQLMKQSRFFSGQVVCHHIEAALNTMVFSTLADYLARRPA